MPRDSGGARRAGGRVRYRQSRLRRSARAGACAEARRTTVSSAAVRARGTGRLLPPREGPCTLPLPRATNLLTDLKEERDGVPWYNSWVVGPVTKIVTELSESLEKHPPI